MAGVNRVLLLGNLGQDPKVKHLDHGNIVANLSLATSESFKDKQGNKVDQTEWHSLEAWGKLAEIAEKYLKKGSRVYVEGKIKSDQWTDDQGNKQKKSKILVSSFQMLGEVNKTEQNQPTSTYIPQEPYSASKAPTSDFPDEAYSEEDNLPF